jgi:endogenous inhibitor of DNA gyrase (YacG/DUF329 family)
MSTTPKPKKASDDSTEVDERSLRALEEYLTVMPDAIPGEDMVRVVSQSGAQYPVDLQEERCACEDYEYNIDGGRCKHIRRALWATGREAIPADVAEAAEVEPNFGAFVDEDDVHVAATDGAFELSREEVANETHPMREDDSDDETIYERAHRLERSCCGCYWQMVYEGERLESRLKENGCLDPEKVDKYCPLCGGTVDEQVLDEDFEEVEV